MSKIKISLLLLSIFNATLHSIAPYTLAEKAAQKEVVETLLEQAHYNLKDRMIERRGNQETGAGFFDVIMPAKGLDGNEVESRVVGYGPGEYVKIHTHDEDELFILQGGKAIFYLLAQSQNGKIGWKSVIKKSGDIIRIPKNTPHGLIASEQGLCMHVPWNDRTRSVNFLTMEQPWDLHEEIKSEEKNLESNQTDPNQKNL